MTGNDIVDIKRAAAESNWKRKGFLEKIFSRHEQEYIWQSALPEEMVWKLWSMKESAYKIYTRQYGGRFFGPKKFSCTLFTQTAGEVSVSELKYQTRTSVTEKFIYSIATPSECTTVPFFNCCFPIAEEDYLKQQEYVYEKIITGYAAIAGIEKKHLILVKNKNGIPFLYNKQDKLTIPVSISHHGNYGAFIISLGTNMQLNPFQKNVNLHNTHPENSNNIIYTQKLLIKKSCRSRIGGGYRTVVEPADR